MNTAKKITNTFLTSLIAVFILISIVFSTSISSLTKIESLNGIEIADYLLEDEHKKDSDENEKDPLKELDDLTVSKNDHAFSNVYSASINQWINAISYNQSILIDIPFPPPKA